MTALIFSNAGYAKSTTTSAAPTATPSLVTAGTDKHHASTEATAATAASTDNAALTTTVTTVPNPKDPLERFNRVMFGLNEFIDNAVLKPAATLYQKIIPKPLAKGFSNFYRNIDTVPTIFNDLLQANFYQAFSDVGRLALNSTVGILGFFDVAVDLGLEPNYEDFGLTLARWGYVNSTYVVLPFLGPATIRDAIGFPVNYYAFSIYPYVHPQSARYALYLFGVVVRRSDYLRYESLMQQISLDKYAFMRDAYLQHRNYLIERNTQLSNPYFGKNNLLEEKELAFEKSTAETAENYGEESKPFSDI